MSENSYKCCFIVTIFSVLYKRNLFTRTHKNCKILILVFLGCMINDIPCRKSNDTRPPGTRAGESNLLCAPLQGYPPHRSLSDRVREWETKNKTLSNTQLPHSHIQWKTARRFWKAVQTRLQGSLGSMPLSNHKSTYSRLLAFPWHSVDQGIPTLL